MGDSKTTGPGVFKLVLKEYCLVENMREANKFVHENFNCSLVRQERFLRECMVVLNKEGPEDTCHPCQMTYDRLQDYIDSLRRAPGVGIGL